MTIRRARRKELKSIAELMIKQFSKPPYNERESIKKVMTSLDFYFKIGRIYVTILGKDLVGVLVFKEEIYWEGPVFIIEDLVIKNDFENKGMGGKLIKFLELEAKKRKVKAIYFKTHNDAKSVSFYKKLGYKTETKTISMKKKLR